MHQLVENPDRLKDILLVGYGKPGFGYACHDSAVAYRVLPSLSLLELSLSQSVVPCEFTCVEMGVAADLRRD